MTQAIKTSHKDHPLFGTFLVALSGLLYGLVGYFGMHLFYQGFSVPGMLFWRFSVASLMMLLLGAFSRRKRAKLTGRVSVTLRLAAIGALSYAGCSSFYYLSSLHVGTGVAMVIFFSFPVFVMLFSFFLENARMDRFTFLALFMVIAGLILLNGSGDHELNLKGIILAIIASFSYAVYVYTSQHSSKKADSLWLTFFICAGCALIFFVYALATDALKMPETPRAWVDIIVLGIVATAIPIQLLLNGLKYVSSVKASILSVLEPIMTVILGVLLLNESVNVMQLLGIVILLSGAVVIQFEKQPVFKVGTPLK